MFAIQYGALAISNAPQDFQDLEQLCRHTTLLIEAGWEEEAANADDAAVALRTKLAGLRPAGLGTWVNELLGRLSRPASTGG